jgi:Mg2+/Co2+ transporter CorB
MNRDKDIEEIIEQMKHSAHEAIYKDIWTNIYIGLIVHGKYNIKVAASDADRALELFKLRWEDGNDVPKH